MLYARMMVVCTGFVGLLFLARTMWSAAAVQYERSARTRVLIGAALLSGAFPALLVLDMVSASIHSSITSWSFYYLMSLPIAYFAVLIPVAWRTHRLRTSRGWSSGLGSGYTPPEVRAENTGH